MYADKQSAPRVLPPEQVDLAVEGLRMLADSTRLQLLWALIDRELSVNELAAAVAKSPASVSQHLAKLRMTQMVRTRREGTQVIYRLENEHIAQLVTDALHNADHAAGMPEHHGKGARLTSLRQDGSATDRGGA